MKEVIKRSRFSQPEVYYTRNGKTSKISKKNLIKKVRGMTFCDYFAWFIATEKEGKIAEVTVTAYYIALKHLEKIAPNMLLVDLENNRRNMQYIIDQFGKTHQKQTTVDFRRHLNVALGFATDDGYIRGFARNGIIIRSVENTWAPEQRAAKKNQVKSFSATEFNKFKYYIDFTLDRTLDEEPSYSHKNGAAMCYQTIYMILSVSIHTGTRFAETIGFKYSDVMPGYININKTWNYRKTKGEFKATKNKSSIRKVTIDPTMYKLLQRYYQFKERNNLPNDPEKPLFFEDARIFNSTINNVLRHIENKLDLPNLTVHKLRHSYASYLLYQDIPPQIVAKQLGHANTQMLFRVYGHILDEKKDMSYAQIRGLLA